MKKALLTPLIFPFFLLSICAQPIIEWEKKINFGRNDELIDFVSLRDGSFLSIGTVSSVTNFYEYNLYKINCKGSIEWSKKFLNRTPSKIDSLDSEKFFVYGHTGKVKDTITNYIAFISIIDTLGNVLKTKEFEGDNFSSVEKIISNMDKTFTVLINSTATDGFFQGNKGYMDTWLLKIDKDLNVISKKNLGGTLNDFGRIIIKLKNDNYILVGGTSSRNGDIKAIYSGQDAFIVKINNNFDIMWSTTFGGNGNDEIDDVIEMPDNGFIVGGGSTSNDGAFQGQPTSGFYSDAFVARINPSGGVSWIKPLGVDRSSRNQYLIWPAYLVPIDSTNFLINTNGKTDEGMLNSKNPVTWLLKMNTLGETIWKKSYGNRTTYLVHKTNKIRMLPDKSFLLVGEATDTIYSNPDFWVLKLSPLDPDNTDECSKLILYPNPTAKDLKIKTSAYFLPNSAVKVIDVLGRNIFSGVIEKGCAEFNVPLPNSLSTGMYFLKVENINKCVLPFFKAE